MTLACVSLPQNIAWNPRLINLTYYLIILIGSQYCVWTRVLHQPFPISRHDKHPSSYSSKKQERKFFLEGFHVILAKSLLIVSGNKHHHLPICHHYLCPSQSLGAIIVINDMDFCICFHRWLVMFSVFQSKSGLIIIRDRGTLIKGMGASQGHPK